MFLIGSLDQSGFLPQIGGQISISGSNGVEGSLDKVTHGLGMSSTGGKDVIDTGVLQYFLGDSSSYDTSSSGSGNQTHADGTAFTGYFGGDSVGQTDSVTPITSSNGDNGQFGEDDSSSDGSGNFFRALHSKTYVSIRISNNNESLIARNGERREEIRTI